ncbi:hypothetical protein JCM8097_009475 [Rhodosporidiobolus ruineniae]
MTDLEKDTLKTEGLHAPQAPQRAYTSPGRAQAGAGAGDEGYARSLSQAELGPISDDQEHDGTVLGGAALSAEPASSMFEAGGSLPNLNVGDEEHASRGKSAPQPDTALRQRRPKPARAATAPAGGNQKEEEPTPGLVRRGTQAVGALFEPKVPVAPAPGWRSSLKATVTYSWLNILLVFVPVSWACHFAGVDGVVTFVMSFIAIIPLAALLGFATEELAIRVGETLGGLLNATFGNAVELIIAILALVKGELDVVQSSMIGSILSNCLLVLGMCYFAGGLRFHEQTYSVRSAQSNINLLVLATTAFVIPVAFHSFLEDDASQPLDTTNASVLKISHGVAFILLFAYLANLAFTLWTHAYLYSPPTPADPADPNAIPPMAPMAPSNYPPDGPQPPEGGVFRIPSLPSWGSSSDSDSSSDISSESSVDHHQPKLSVVTALTLLVFVTVITGVTAEWLVSGIEDIVSTGNVSEQFVALILLPLVGNAAEHVTAVTVSTKDRLDLAMGVAVGSSIQIALFVVPILILLGWCVGQPLSFYFDEFETLILFISVLAVAFATNDGRTNWLEGLCLMLIYILIALVIWFYDPSTTGL